MRTRHAKTIHTQTYTSHTHLKSGPKSLHYNRLKAINTNLLSELKGFNTISYDIQSSVSTLQLFSSMAWATNQRDFAKIDNHIKRLTRNKKVLGPFFCAKSLSYGNNRGATALQHTHNAPAANVSLTHTQAGSYRDRFQLRGVVFKMPSNYYRHPYIRVSFRFHTHTNDNTLTDVLVLVLLLYSRCLLS